MLIAVNPNPQPTNLDYRQVRDILGHLESRKLLAPLVVLQELAKNPALPLGVVRDYVARQLTVEGAAIEQDRAAIAKLTAETMQLRTEANELKTKVSVGGGGGGWISLGAESYHTRGIYFDSCQIFYDDILIYCMWVGFMKESAHVLKTSLPISHWVITGSLNPTPRSPDMMRWY